MAYNLLVAFALVMTVMFYVTGQRRGELIALVFAGLWFIFSIEHYSTNDYNLYYEGFYNPPLNLWEPLYMALITVFRPTGYVFFNSVMAAFEVFTLGFLMWKVVPKQWFWLAIFILLVDPANALYLMGTKRQTIAIALTIWVLYVLLFSRLRYKYVIALLILLAAVNIHTSAYMVVPFFALPMVKRRPNLLGCVAIAVVFVGLSGLILDNTSMLLSILERLGLVEHYSYYIDVIESFDGGESSTGLITVVYNILIVVGLLFTSRFCSDNQYRISLLAVAGFFFAAVLFADLLRLGWYYSVYNYVAIPVMVSCVWKHINKIFAGVVVAVIMLLPMRQYYLVMTGQSPAHQIYKVQYFYTIFHDVVDKSTFSSDEM